MIAKQFGQSQQDLAVVACGFDFDADLRVELPDDYEVVEVTPEPTETDGNDLLWSATEDLDGFELVAASEEPMETDDTADADDEPGAGDVDDDSLPGFGIVAALGALAGYGMVRVYRRGE